MSVFWLVLIALGVLSQGRRIPRQIYYEGQGAQSHGLLQPIRGHTVGVEKSKPTSFSGYQGGRLPRQIYYEGQGAQSHGLLKVPLAHAPQTAVGHCKLTSSSGHQVAGEIILSQNNPQDPVQITGSISGLAPGYHGFHIHQNANLADNCKAAGPHFNPENKSHGAPQDPNRHAGDLGNIPVDANGVSEFQILDGQISLFDNNPRQVLGRSIVVHQKEDDLGRGYNEESKKTGNAGARVACCVIELVQPYHL